MKGYISKKSRIIEYVAHESEIKGFNENGNLELENLIIGYVTETTHEEIEIEKLPEEFYQRRFMLTEDGEIIQNPLWIKPESARIKELQTKIDQQDEIINMLIVDSLGV